MLLTAISCAFCYEVKSCGASPACRVRRLGTGVTVLSRLGGLAWPVHFSSNWTHRARPTPQGTCTKGTCNTIPNGLGPYQSNSKVTFSMLLRLLRPVRHPYPLPGVACGVYGTVGIFGASIFGAHTESNIMVSKGQELQAPPQPARVRTCSRSMNQTPVAGP